MKANFERQFGKLQIKVWKVFFGTMKPSNAWGFHSFKPPAKKNLQQCKLSRLLFVNLAIFLCGTEKEAIKNKLKSAMTRRGNGKKLQSDYQKNRPLKSFQNFKKMFIKKLNGTKGYFFFKRVFSVKLR